MGLIDSFDVSEEGGEDSEQEEACEVTTPGRRSSTAGFKREEIVALHHSLSWEHRGTEGSLASDYHPILNSISVCRSKSKNKSLKLSHCSIPLTYYRVKVNRVTAPLQIQCRQTSDQQRSNIIHR